MKPTVKIIAVIGPTASGKSALAVKIAEWAKRQGTPAEVISADSRQIYRGLDIGSGKITKREMRGVKHHLLDVASPLRQYSVAQYQKSARAILYTLLANGSVLIICGGTALYIDALLYDYPIPAVQPNPALRKTLEKKSTEELFDELARRDPRRAAEIDRYNKRRLVRALEIVRATGAPIAGLPLRQLHAYTQHSDTLKNIGLFIPEVLKIGLRPTDAALKARIAKRLHSRLKQGMIEEVKRLHARGLSWKRLDAFGLEYRFVSRYLRGMITKDEVSDAIEKESLRYAKRQMTWWKRDKEIRWVKNEHEAVAAAKKFLDSRLRGNDNGITKAPVRTTA